MLREVVVDERCCCLGEPITTSGARWISSNRRSLLLAAATAVELALLRLGVAPRRRRTGADDSEAETSGAEAASAVSAGDEARRFERRLDMSTPGS